MGTVKRDQSVEILKFIAAIMVVNSHIGVMYASDFKQLATGGRLVMLCSSFARGLHSS